MKTEHPVRENIIEFIPAIRMMLSAANTKITRLLNNDTINQFCEDRKSLEKTFDLIRAQKNSPWDGKFIYLEETATPQDIITSFIRELEDFRAGSSTPPQIIAIKGYGLLAVGRSSHAVSLLLETFENALDSLLTNEEKPKRKASDENIVPAHPDILHQKICIVTGGAQGFGEGISRSMLLENANLVIADLNEEKGLATSADLTSLCKSNELIFVKTDVSSPESVKNLVIQTVKNFGGIDVFVSNAGILKAGGLDEMEPASFELMTKINYEGYFLCSKYASAVMKLQSKYKEGYYSDIIQINSKSGLKGSNRNFAYAGGKFGGIGLTQSFALELAPFRVKVNAICPGNFFEGPLWSDSEQGLFVQYLRAGKVPGAKTVEDVKRFYEKQVPLGRGCRVEDVMKAIKYIVSQEYETGQAVPVTGGQEMLS